MHLHVCSFAETTADMSTLTKRRVPKRWTVEEDRILYEEAQKQSTTGLIKDWNTIASRLPGRTNKDCRKRWVNKVRGCLKKGAWDEEEDERLLAGVRRYGQKWTMVANEVGYRSPDQCAKRWQYSLDPKLDHAEWTPAEDELLMASVQEHGREWKFIQEMSYPTRSRNDLKNRFTILSRRLNVGSRESTSDPASSISNGSTPEMTLVKDEHESMGGILTSNMNLSGGDQHHHHHQHPHHQHPHHQHPHHQHQHPHQPPTLASSNFTNLHATESWVDMSHAAWLDQISPVNTSPIIDAFSDHSHMFGDLSHNNHYHHPHHAHSHNHNHNHHMAKNNDYASPAIIAPAPHILASSTPTQPQQQTSTDSAITTQWATMMTNQTNSHHGASAGGGGGAPSSSHDNTPTPVMDQSQSNHGQDPYQQQQQQQQHEQQQQQQQHYQQHQQAQEQQQQQQHQQRRQHPRQNHQPPHNLDPIITSAYTFSPGANGSNTSNGSNDAICLSSTSTTFPLAQRHSSNRLTTKSSFSSSFQPSNRRDSVASTATSASSASSQRSATGSVVNPSSPPVTAAAAAAASPAPQAPESSASTSSSIAESDGGVLPLTPVQEEFSSHVTAGAKASSNDMSASASATAAANSSSNTEAQNMAAGGAGPIRRVSLLVEKCDRDTLNYLLDVTSPLGGKVKLQIGT